METEEREISEGETRLALEKLLTWLQDHDLSHFFVGEVDPDEYPDYRQVCVGSPVLVQKLSSVLLLLAAAAAAAAVVVVAHLHCLRPFQASTFSQRTQPTR